jgi:hypothetical protein
LSVEKALIEQHKRILKFIILAIYTFCGVVDAIGAVVLSG